MQIITLKKDKLHLTRLSLDNGSEALIDNDVCFERCLKVGSNLTESSLKELLEESDYRRAKSRAVWYLDRADHTEKGLYDKLLRGGFKKESAAKVVARFIEVGLLDDRRFAKNYAERLESGNYSKREILQKLTLKGVPYAVAKEVLEDTENGEQQKIKSLLEKKYQTKLQKEGGAQKVFASLVRKGFSYAQVREALKSYIEEFEE